MRKVFASSGPARSAVIARRLERHHLLEPAPRERMVDVVSDICGVHAQVASSSELMVGLRVRDVTRHDLREALFVVGSHPRSKLIEPGSPIAAASPGTAAPLAVVLRAGRVAGVWERKPKGKRMLVRVDAYRPLTRKHRAAIEEQAVRTAAILERDCELEFGPVDLRPHA